MHFDNTTSGRQQDSLLETQELNAQEMEALVGGAGSFLQGELVSSQDKNVGSDSQVVALSQPENFAYSGVTLCHWEDCTLGISGCE